MSEKGDPLGVTDVKLLADGDKAKLSWTAPTEGKLSSYIDVNTLNYDVIRFKNSSLEGENGCNSNKRRHHSQTRL